MVSAPDSRPRSCHTAHTMSDSDTEDSLTKINTALNKSMTLMESTSKTTQSNKIGKSVKISVKEQPPTMKSEVKQRKSILKKPEVPRNNYEEEDDGCLEQSLRGEVDDGSVKNPTILPRPLNLSEFVRDEAVAVDETDATFSLCDLSDSEDIWIMDIPRTVNPKELKGQKLILGGKSKFRTGVDCYHARSRECQGSLSCVFRTGKEKKPYKAVNIKPAGLVIVRQKLSRAPKLEPQSPEKKSVPFPTDLKIRHPLFGANYNNEVNIKVDVKTKVHPKLKRRSNTSRTSESNEEVSSREIEVSSQKKKAPKIKKSIEDGNQTWEISLHEVKKSEEPVLERKEEKKKQKRNSDPSTLSVDAEISLKKKSFFYELKVKKEKLVPDIDSVEQFERKSRKEKVKNSEILEKTMKNTSSYELDTTAEMKTRLVKDAFSIGEEVSEDKKKFDSSEVKIKVEKLDSTMESSFQSEHLESQQIPDRKSKKEKKLKKHNSIFSDVGMKRPADHEIEFDEDQGSPKAHRSKEKRRRISSEIKIKTDKIDMELESPGHFKKVKNNDSFSEIAMKSMKGHANGSTNFL